MRSIRIYSRALSNRDYLILVQKNHRIEFPEKYKIPAPRLYRLAPSEDAELQKQLKDLTEHGYIKPVSSPFGSGILFVQKANGKLRMVVDYRPINRLTVMDKYPISEN